jgi:tripartite-type tricarboxylate transporter receptor subunit TctC
LAPAGTPKPIVDAVNTAILAAAKQPDLIERFTKLFGKLGH